MNKIEELKMKKIKTIWLCITDVMGFMGITENLKTGDFLCTNSISALIKTKANSDITRIQNSNTLEDETIEYMADNGWTYESEYDHVTPRGTAYYACFQR